MNMQFSDYVLLVIALGFLVTGYFTIGAAMLLGGVLYHATAFELNHRFMNDVRKEVGLAPLGRRERYNNKPLLKDADDLPPLKDSDRSWNIQ